jgi:predicted dehydrogenase
MIHGWNFARNVPGAELVGLVDPDQDLCRGNAESLGVDSASTLDPFLHGRADAVVIATPTRFHRDIALSALQAGLHVLCEKPMATTVAECREMCDAAESADVTFQLGFMRRFDAGFIEVAERLQGGEIGQPVSIRSLTYGPSIPKPWMYDISGSNGPLAEVNSHDIDTLLWYADSEVEEVFAIAGNYRCDDARESHPDFYDNVTMTVRFANGTQGLVQGAQGVRYGYDSRCEVLGQRGLLTVGTLPVGSVRSHTPDGYGGRIVQSWRDLFAAAYLAEDRDFSACIREGRAPRAGAKEGLRALEVVIAGNRSIVEGRPVRLSEVREVD